MIKEWLEYLRTPSTPLAKTKGLLQQSVALKFRADRLEKQWAGHLQNCDQLLKDSIGKNRIDSVLVLGSGHLLETQVETLSLASRVGLVDLLHPISSRKTAAKNNWQLFEMDLSGVWKPEDLASLSATASSYDLIVSANLLSQLPWSSVHSRNDLTEAELQNQMSKILLRHWRFLKSLNKPTLIWTDVEEIHRDKNEEIIAQGSTLPGLELPKAIKEWTWDFAPAPEIYPDRSVELLMQAFKLNF